MDGLLYLVEHSSFEQGLEMDSRVMNVESELVVDSAIFLVAPCKALHLWLELLFW